jgi:hypothetical protein
MAQSQASTETLRDRAVNELTCIVCKSLFEDPVVLKCGHAFCRICITQWIEGGAQTCPSCKATAVIGRGRCVAIANLVSLFSGDSTGSTEKVPLPVPVPPKKKALKKKEEKKDDGADTEVDSDGVDVYSANSMEDVTSPMTLCDPCVQMLLSKDGANVTDFTSLANRFSWELCESCEATVSRRNRAIDDSDDEYSSENEEGELSSESSDEEDASFSESSSSSSESEQERPFTHLRHGRRVAGERRGQYIFYPYAERPVDTHRKFYCPRRHPCRMCARYSMWKADPERFSNPRKACEMRPRRGTRRRHSRRRSARSRV